MCKKLLIFLLVIVCVSCLSSYQEHQQSKNHDDQINQNHKLHLNSHQRRYYNLSHLNSHSGRRYNLSHLNSHSSRYYNRSHQMRGNYSHNRVFFSEHDLSHKLNGQQCIKQKGFVCGTFIQNCCKDGCYKSWFLGPETCLNNNFLTIQENKCEDACKQKGGILCSNILQDPECCPQSACTKGLTNKCNQTQKLNITGCYQNNFMDTVTGIFK